MRTWLAIAAGVLVAGLAVSRPVAGAPAAVKIGVLMPLSGNAGAAGQASKAAIEVGAQIVNEAHPEMANIPLAATAGLPKLGGAKIQLVFADHQGDPSLGQSEALRLITQDHVSALLGAYQSSVTLAATTVAQRNGIPWMTVAIVNENTDYGTSVGGGIKDELAKDGYTIAAQIPYNANGTDVSAQVLQLKQKHPDVVIFVSYTSDSILFMKTFKSLSYKPSVVIGDDSGFSDPSFVTTVGSLAQGAVNRSAWGVGKPGSATYRINQMYKAKTGRDLDDTSGRNMQGFLVLADAINRAGSTNPEAMRAALAATNLTPKQLMMGYKGIRFDATGQNVLASTYLTQLAGTDWVTVWPKSAAGRALVWPFRGWQP